MNSKYPHALFSIATNGYEKKFERCIRSHIESANKLQIPYYCIKGKPPWGISAHDSAWLKVFALDFLLRKHKSGVFYLDADAEVTKDAPDFRKWDNDCPDKSFFIPLSGTNRVQSCVMYCRSTTQCRKLIARICFSSLIPSRFIPREDRNLYENGHIIWLSKNSPCLHILPQKWNSGLGYAGIKTDSPYIIHYGGDEMREVNNANPFSLIQRINASWTGLRIPIHMLWFRKALC